ncbi:MAG: motility associated factor glycosyltransferase family protein [Hyphomicrobiales bacterium]|nr:motility associated factor glycosyltransferase family protein [Hyphomicrobiales bacterium]
MANAGAGPHGDSLFRRNCAAFRARQPTVWALLETFAEPDSRLVRDGDTAVNIDLGEVRLYPKPAPDWSRAQVEAHVADPDHIGFSDPAHCNLSPISRRLLAEVRDHFAAHPQVAVAPAPVVDVGYGFVFGVGLGHHVAELVRRAACRYLILVEPVPEFLRHSLHAVDWEEIFSTAEGQGMELHFVVGADPEGSVLGIERVVFLRNQTFLDGSFALMHYLSWELRQAREILNRKIKTYYLSRGFFEDELLMTGNTYGNLRGGPFHVIGHKPYVEQKTPVFIVGSGPSLDAALPQIAKWADRVVIISCGSSLGILLKNGIRPHLHIENENTEPLVKNLQDFKAAHGLDGITLVASTSVRPEAGALFDRRWFYFRTHLSCTAIFNRGLRPLPGAAPLVANAAFAVATATGFRDIYLFGVDCGRRAEDGHHAGDAIYYDADYDNYLEGEGLELLETEFTRTVPGNFGGEVLTTWYLDMSRVDMAALQSITRANLVNCSNGARIDGARPMAPAAVNITAPPGGAAAALALVEQQLAAFAPDEFLAPLDLPGHVAGCDTFAAAFDAEVDRALEEDTGFWEFERRMSRFRSERAGDCLAVLTILGGTFMSMIRLGAFGGTRITDPAARRRFLRHFMERYRAYCQWMAAETRAMLAEMAAGADRLSPVGRADDLPQPGPGAAAP